MKNKGSHSLEVALLMPVLIVIIILIIDHSIYLHNRLTVLAQLDTMHRAVARHVSDASLQWLVNEESDLEYGNIHANKKYEKSLLDSLTIVIKESDLMDRITKELDESVQDAVAEIEIDQITLRQILFRKHVVFKYSIQVYSPFSKWTRNTAHNGIIHQEVVLQPESILEEYHTIDTLLDSLGSSSDIQSLIQSIQQLFVKVIGVFD
jgi:hypothetical protein